MTSLCFLHPRPKNDPHHPEEQLSRAQGAEPRVETQQSPDPSSEFHVAAPGLLTHHDHVLARHGYLHDGRSTQELHAERLVAELSRIWRQSVHRGDELVVEELVATVDLVVAKVYEFAVLWRAWKG